MKKISRGNKGTLELSKSVGLAPKNIISRVKKLEKENLLKKDKIKLKPKGWKRKLFITKGGKEFLAFFEKIKNVP